MEPLERTEPVQTQQPIVKEPKPRRSKAPLVLTLLLLLALIGCGALGWLAFDQSNQRASLQGQAEVKQEQVNKLNEELKAERASNEIDDSNDTTTNTSDADSDELIEAALTYAKTLNSGMASAKLLKTEGLFASVNITFSDRVETAVLKKSEDVWIVLVSSDAPISRETVSRYSIPTSIIAD